MPYDDWFTTPKERIITMLVDEGTALLVHGLYMLNAAAIDYPPRRGYYITEIDYQALMWVADAEDAIAFVVEELDRREAADE